MKEGSSRDHEFFVSVGWLGVGLADSYGGVRGGTFLGWWSAKVFRHLRRILESVHGSIWT